MQIELKSVSEILGSMVGTFSEKKFQILLEAVNKRLEPSEQISGVNTGEGHIWGSREGIVITWKEFAQKEVEVATIGL